MVQSLTTIESLIRSFWIPPVLEIYKKNAFLFVKYLSAIVEWCPSQDKWNILDRKPSSELQLKLKHVKCPQTGNNSESNWWMRDKALHGWPLCAFILFKKKLQCPFPETFLEEIIFIRMIFEGTQKIHMFINVIFVHVSSILYCHKSLQNAFPQLIFEGKGPKREREGFQNNWRRKKVEQQQTSAWPRMCFCRCPGLAGRDYIIGFNPSEPTVATVQSSLELLIPR